MLTLAVILAAVPATPTSPVYPAYERSFYDAPAQPRPMTEWVGPYVPSPRSENTLPDVSKNPHSSPQLDDALKIPAWLR